VVGISSIMRHSQPLVQLRAETLIIGADAFSINQSEQLGALRASADLELHASADGAKGSDRYS
jgi:hypothetical protein